MKTDFPPRERLGIPQKHLGTIVMRHISTKLDSFIRTDTVTARERVLRALTEANRALSRAEIAEYTGLSLASVCGRVNELLKLGEVRVAGKKFDHFTDRNVEIISLTTTR